MREKTSLHWRAIAVVCTLIVSLCVATLRSHSESKNSWQLGTIMEVKAHEVVPGEKSDAKQYDISVKVGKKIFVGLYTLGPDQWEEPDSCVGMERPVLIEGNTLKFNDVTGRTRTMRILRSKDAPPKNQK